MNHKTVAWVTCLLCLGLMLGTTSEATGQPNDPAARGLDLFVHLPTSAAPGAAVPVQVQALGFPTVTTVKPLAGAAIEAVWDPRSLGKNISVAPPPVRATTDTMGRAHLDVRIPDGPERDLNLLIGVRSGSHHRTRTVKVTRLRAYDVSLFVTDDKVVPGSTISTWVLVRKATTQQPVASLPVRLSLLEGGMVRREVRLTTDAAGSAAGRVAIPPSQEPSFSWTLQARVASQKNRDAGSAKIVLTPREETPGTPRMWAQWSDDAVRPGATASFVIGLRDASDEPVAKHQLRYWIGPTGTNPPTTKEEWDKIAKHGTTTIAGAVRGSMAAPTTVAPIVGTDLRLVARAMVAGQALEATTSVHVGAPAPTVKLLPTAGVVVGGLEQQLLLRAQDGWGRPIVGTFSVTGDGLDAKVTTSADGDAQVTWTPPVTVGARRDVGPCAQGIAAAVVVRPLEDLPAFGGRRGPVEICVPIDRETPGLVQVDQPVVKAGEPLRIQVLGRLKAPWSVTLTSQNGAQATSAWLDDGSQGGTVTLPAGASGLWTVSAVTPGRKEGGQALPATILAVPPTLPLLTAVMSGGRAAPGGKVTIDARLSDGHGKGLTGTIAAVAFDLHGGGSARGLRSIDTRSRLCDAAGVDDKRCRAFLEEDATMNPVRRGLLGARHKRALGPVLDPGASADEDMRKAFAAVMQSLEGAVYEACQSPERLRDAGRKGPGGAWTFNPELWTLTTAAMKPKPVTPGGEPFALSDLMAIDSQVSFDKVARRVTRLKLLRVLSAVHGFVRDNYLSPDEPALSDPPALLRRLVRDGRLSGNDLLDPWGGTMQFVKARGARLPFLSLRGYQLQAPGPDGRIGTQDDLRGPFERVLRSGTPYAAAVGEDRIVDAKLDMRVAESTIQAWESLLEELTGTRLGRLGLGTGQGFGSGHGRLGGSHRARAPRVRMGHSIVTGNAFWLPPQRTDESGRVRLIVPLGDVETTWRVALLGVPDHAQPAVAKVDIPITVPLSARVAAGAQWTVGDEVGVEIMLRNRTHKATKATLSIVAKGVAELTKSGGARKVVRIPAMGAATTTVRVKAAKAGGASLEVRTSAAGLADDLVRHQWEVKPAGERTIRSQMASVEGRKEIALPFERQRSTPVGPTRLVLELGHRPLLEAALNGIDPDRARSPEAIGDALEVAVRIHQWALLREGKQDPLALHALDVARRAKGRLSVYANTKSDAAVVRGVVARVHLLGGPVDTSTFERPDRCPPEGAPTLETALQYLEAEPPPVGGVIHACWDGFVTSAADVIQQSGEPVALARAIVAMSERRHRRVMANALAARLREQVELAPTGRIRLPLTDSRSPATRAIVYAALLRTADRGGVNSPDRSRLATWLAIQRDPHGGYGSSLATRAAVTALLTLEPGGQDRAQVTVVTAGKRKAVVVGSTKPLSLNLAQGTTKVILQTSGPGLIARLERRTLRRWSRPPTQLTSPAKLEIAWPSLARVGRPERLQVSLSHDLGRPTTLDARIPLPPGVTLAAPTSGVRQVQGVLTIRRKLDSSGMRTVLQIPIRFGLRGKVTAPEAQARLAFEEAARAVAPARPLLIR